MYKIGIVAAMEREVHGLVRTWKRVRREHEGCEHIFFEKNETVCLCVGIGPVAARRGVEALIALYHPARIHSVGFAGGLSANQKVGDILTPALVVDARDNSRYQIPGGQGTLITFMEVANKAQKGKLAAAYNAQAVDMEAAVVAAAAQLHGIPFAATKVISDEVDFGLPDTARFITPQGEFDSVGFAVYAAVRPWLWPRVAALASNSNKAAKALAAHLQRMVRDQAALHVSPDATLTPGGRN